MPSECLFASSETSLPSPEIYRSLLFVGATPAEEMLHDGLFRTISTPVYELGLTILEYKEDIQGCAAIGEVFRAKTLLS